MHSLEALDMAVALQRGQHYVHDPQRKEENGGWQLVFNRTSQFSTTPWHSPNHHESYADEGETTEHRY